MGPVPPAPRVLHPGDVHHALHGCSAPRRVQSVAPRPAAVAAAWRALEQARDPAEASGPA